MKKRPLRRTPAMLYHSQDEFPRGSSKKGGRMSRLVKVTLALAVSISFTLTTPSQQQSARKAASKTPAAADDKISPRQRRALSILDRILQTSAGFEDIALKLKIQAEAAGMLWSFDEPRARKMYEASFHGIDAIKPASDERIQAQFLPGFKARLQAEILKALSLHDKDFAASLAKSAADEQPSSGETVTRCVGCGVQSASVSQTLRLAFTTAPTDPQRALKLAKEGLSGGLSSLIYSVLVALRGKDGALADELFRYSITIARQQAVYLTDGAYFLAPYVFPGFGAGAIKVSPRPAPANVKPEIIELYLTYFAEAAEKEAMMLQARGRDASDSQFGRRVSFDYFLGELMLPYFERHMPERAAAVRARIEDIIGTIAPDEAKPFLDDLKRERTPSFLAEKAGDEQDVERQQSRYVDAAFQANARREYDEALSIVRKIGDDSIRSFVESRVRYDRARAALNDDTDVAYKLAGDVSDPSKRASLLAGIASNRFYRKDAQGAAEALAEAEQTIEKAEPGLEKAIEMVNLVSAAAFIDLARGFEVMKSAVDALNSAEVPREWGFNKPVLSRSGKMFTWVYAGLELLTLDQGFQRLARADFERSLQIASAIQSTEALALAELALCKIALSQPHTLPRETVKTPVKPVSSKETKLDNKLRD